MVAPLITSTSDPIIALVRSHSVLLDDQSTFPANKLVTNLNVSAFPKVRGYLLTAKGGDNMPIFYSTDLADLAGTTAQNQADLLVTQVMTQSIVKDWVYRIAAMLTAASMVRYLAAQLPEQAAAANDIRDEAERDLKLLVSSAELKAAVAEALQKTELAKTSKDDTPKIYLALDADPTTFNATSGQAKPHAGALESGKATLWVGPWSVEATVNVGETPETIMNRLASAVRSYMLLNPAPAARFNLVVGPNEGHLNPYARFIEVTDPLGNTEVRTAAVNTRMGWLSFHAHQYHTDIDALFCTLELTNDSGQLGIKGLLYGTMDGELDYNRLSPKGPYSVFIDVETGKAGVTNPTTSRSPIDDFASDTFWFNVSALGGRTTKSGQVRYQVAHLVSMPAGTIPQPRTVYVPSGSSAMDVIQLIARDMDSVAYTSKVLGAVRSPTSITVMGDPISAPGLRLVAYQPSDFQNKLVFDMLEVPEEVNFGVLPSTYVTNGAFDNQAKSLVLSVQYVVPRSGAVSNPTDPDPATGTGYTKHVQVLNSERINKAWNDINSYGW